MNSWFHAVSCSKKWGGEPEEYYPIHAFIDSSKRTIGDVRHRALYHHTEGIFLCERLFGTKLTLGGGRRVPVREIAELHVLEDLGWLPNPADYIVKNMSLATWMGGKQHRRLPLNYLGVK